MTLYKWSQTAASNGTADTTCPFPEGMAPSAVNDSTRGAMAAVAKYRDDIAGAIVTAGTSTAYTVASFQGFDSLAHLSGQMIAFTPHATNGAAPTLNVDGLGAKPLRMSPNVAPQSNVLIQGTPYVALYSASDGAFYVQGIGGNAYGIPLGAGMDFWGTTAPSSAFAFPFGQAISRTTYASLFTLLGTTYGVGDGSTTFNLPDKRGRVSATPDSMGGGSDPNRLTGSASMAASRNSIGGVGGESGHTLSSAEMPVHSHSTNVSDPGHTHSIGGVLATNGTNSAAPAGGPSFTVAGGSVTIAPAQTNIAVSINNTGSGGAHENMPPTILCNYIIRII